MPRVPIRKLGAGMYGEVWLEHDLALNRERAVKYVEVSANQNSDIFREPRILEELGHENIVKVFEADLDSTNRLYVVMEYLPRGSLADAMAQGPIRLSDAVKWVADVARAVQFAHERGYVHRDIKPSNILLTENGVAKLSDFGLAARLGEDGLAPALGYAPHLAPEAFDSNKTSSPYGRFCVGLDCLSSDKWGRLFAGLRIV